MHPFNTLNMLYKMIRSRCDEKSNQYANMLQATLISAARYVLYNEDFYSSLKQCYVNEQSTTWSSADRNLWELKAALKRQDMLNDTNRLGITLGRMMYLFRECYADISMIYLLRPSRVDYFELAAKEWETLSIDCANPKTDNRYFVFLGRVETILSLDDLWPAQGSAEDQEPENTAEIVPMGNWITHWEETAGEKEEHLRSFLEDIKLFYQWSRGELPEEWKSKQPSYFIAREHLRCLKDYLEHCYKTIEKTFVEADSDSESARKSKELSFLNALYQAVASKPDSPNYEKYEQCLNFYRDSITQKKDCPSV